MDDFIRDGIIEGSPLRIRRPLLIGFVVALGVMLLFFAISFDWMRDALEKDAYGRVEREVAGAFQRVMAENARSMETILHTMRGNPRFLVPFRERDRPGLLTATSEVLEYLRRESGITHFYFHDPDRVNFLRVYNPSRFGDVIQRQTLLEAQKSGATAHGLELGAKDTLTLRVVSPWREQGEIIGFVELGKEVKTLLEPIKGMLQIELFLFLEKKFLNRQDWEAGMALFGRPVDWQQYEKFVFAAGTMADLPVGMDKHIRDGSRKISQPDTGILHDVTHYHFVTVPVADMGGRAVARLVVVYDDAKTESVTWKHMLLLLLGNLIAAVLLGVVFHRFLVAMEQRLERSTANLRHSEQRLRAILDTAMDAIISIDARSRVLEFNPAAERIFGFRKQDILGKDLSELLIPLELREHHRQGMARYLATGHKRFINQHIELIAMDAQGARLPTEIAITVTPGSQFIYFTAYLRDITERKQMLKSLEDTIAATECVNLELREEMVRHQKTLSLLQASEERFRSVTTSIQDALIAADHHQHIIFWNRGAQALFGYTEEEILGMGLSLLVPERYGEAHQLGFQRCLTREGCGPLVGQVTELAGIHKDGREIPLEMSLNSWVTADGQRFFSAVVRDIALRKQAENALQEAKEASEKANQAKSIFLANMSHEIRTPMNTIIGMGYLLAQSLREPSQRSQMHKIQTAAETLLGIIDDILDFSKIEAGHLELEHRPFNLHGVLEKVSDMIALRAEEKGLEVLFDIPACLPRALIGDALRLEQILINLGTNAVKFTRQGEIVLRIEEVECDHPATMLRFTVQDTGIGLSEEQIAGLFQAFTQADSSTTRNYGGTGLGLAICKRLVEKMGGDISVSSIASTGSEFVFTVPFEQQLLATAEELIKPANLPPLRVLVVDDNDCARQILQNMVEDLGFRCASVCSGEACITELERVALADLPPYNVVLLDWRMPCMDGIETARLIKNHSLLAKSSMVVMVTAFGRPEVMKEAKEVGIRGVILKPVTPSVLLDTVLDIAGGYALSLRDEAANGLEVGEHRTLLNGARILVVEDHEVNWQVAEGVLSKVGVLTQRAANGLIAVERLLAGRDTFDCVLMDLQMPVMDGYEATRRLREKFSQETLPIIAMTAHALKSEQERCLALGMNDYLTKPINVKTLFKTLSKILAPVLAGGTHRPAVAQGETPLVPIMAVYGVDVADALERIDGDGELLKRLLSSFTRKFPPLAAELAVLLGQGEMAGVKHVAHGIKGSAGNVSAKKVAALAAEIETMATHHDVAGCGVVLSALTQEMEQLTSAVARLLASSPIQPSPAEEGGVAEEQPLADALAELYRLLKDQDFQARGVFAALRGPLARQVDSHTLAQLEESLNSLEFDRGANIVAQLLSPLRQADE